MSASCMPALANMARSGEEWKILRSKLSSFRSQFSQGLKKSSKNTSKGSGYITKDGYFGQTVNEPYSTVEESGGYEMNKIRAGVTEDHVPLK